MKLRDLAAGNGDGPRRAAAPRLARRPTAQLRVLPDYLLIGAQKAGTTSLQHHLTGHPDVRSPLVKEVHFFDHHWERGTGWYRTHFPVGRRDRTWITGDASPYYLLHPDAPRRAALVVPEARLVAVLRDPITRAYSHFQHSRALGHEPVDDFATALALESERTDDAWRTLQLTGRRQPAVEWFSYVRRGRYAPQLRRWLAEFPFEQLLVLTSEDLFRDAAEALALTHAHLGLAHRGGARLEARHTRSYPPMTAQVRAYLTSVFADDVAEVEQLLGRATGWTAGWARVS